MSKPIQFPNGMEPTPCKNRTRSFVGDRNPEAGRRHGAEKKIVQIPIPQPDKIVIKGRVNRKTGRPNR